MPTYQYKCDRCHCSFEERQRFDEEPIALCPECQGQAHRVFNSVPVIFKGSGFYTTDNRKASANESEKGEDKLPDKKN